MGAADARLALTTVATRGPAPAAAALQEHSASQMGASKVALVSAAVVLAVLQQPAASKLIAPSWDYAFPTQKQTCVNATASTPADKGTNERWVFHAVPEGTPPASGWPVWLSLVTDTFGSLDGHSECGGGGRPGFRRRTQHHGSSGKSFKAFDTPNATMTSCFKTPPGPPPPPSPWGHQSDCDYDQEAGALWNQRLKQYLIANGVAVVSVNPFTEDSWDAGPWWWDSGVDEPFLTKVFKMMKAGEFGKLDTDNVVVRGWSGGAQMVSWISQVRATNTTSEFTQSFKMKGGVMMSGGSYLCYNDPQDPTNPPGAMPIGSCQGCTEGGPSHCQDDPKCSSCDTSVKTYCGQCCPRNFTEPYFAEDPARYKDHPPMFLGQTSKTDNHADLCACRNYYETLVANGVSNSKLELVKPDEESCFCIGSPTEPAAAGSPYAIVQSTAPTAPTLGLQPPHFAKCLPGVLPLPRSAVG
jgi:hypothetical protein